MVCKTSHLQLYWICSAINSFESKFKCIDRISLIYIEDGEAAKHVVNFTGPVQI